MLPIIPKDDYILILLDDESDWLKLKPEILKYSINHSLEIYLDEFYTFEEFNPFSIEKWRSISNSSLSKYNIIIVLEFKNKFNVDSLVVAYNKVSFKDGYTAIWDYQTNMSEYLKKHKGKFFTLKYLNRTYQLNNILDGK